MTDNQPCGNIFNEPNVLLLSDDDSKNCGVKHEESGILIKSLFSLRTHTTVDDTLLDSWLNICFKSSIMTQLNNSAVKLKVCAQGV